MITLAIVPVLLQVLVIGVVRLVIFVKFVVGGVGVFLLFLLLLFVDVTGIVAVKVPGLAVLMLFVDVTFGIVVVQILRLAVLFLFTVAAVRVLVRIVIFLLLLLVPGRAVVARVAAQRRPAQRPALGLERLAAEEGIGVRVRRRRVPPEALAPQERVGDARVLVEGPVEERVGLRRCQAVVAVAHLELGAPRVRGPLLHDAPHVAPVGARDPVRRQDVGAEPLPAVAAQARERRRVDVQHLHRLEARQRGVAPRARREEPRRDGLARRPAVPRRRRRRVGAAAQTQRYRGGRPPHRRGREDQAGSDQFMPRHYCHSSGLVAR